MKKALVTGSTGFIGQHLMTDLQSAGWDTVAAGRDWQGALTHASSDEKSQESLQGIDTVFHLAGLAHAGAQGADRAQLFAVNEQDTLAFYQSCVAAGVKQFIWLSSIKVLGDTSRGDLTVDAAYAPGDDYAHSKVAAEQALLAEPAAKTILRIVRPPLVYGPGVRANFLALVQLALSRWLLPLASAQAARAWVSVHNLTNFLVTLAATQESSTTHVFHVRDAQQSSVSEMVSQIRRIEDRKPGLWPIPPWLVLALAKLFGRREQAARLFLPLTVDMEVSESLLNWHPPFKQQDELAKVVAWYRE